VVDALLTNQRLELRPGRADEVAQFVAERLEGAREGSSLLSSLEAALLACADVEELYADLDELKDLVEGLR
ncbi:MAG: hypothetical protein AAF211_14680, partial [Myxococcota bacterium]